MSVAGRVLLLSAVLALGTAASPIEASLDCNRKLSAIFCLGCESQDAGITPAWKKRIGGALGACQQCTNVRCGDFVEAVADGESFTDSTEANCGRAVEDYVVTNAVASTEDLLTIAEHNPYVAVAVFFQQFDRNNPNPAGIGGSTALTRTLSAADVRDLIADPSREVGTAPTDLSGVVIDASIVDDDSATITYEYRATRLTLPDETRIPDGPPVRLTFDKVPVYSRVVGTGPVVKFQGLRLSGIQIAPQ